MAISRLQIPNTLREPQLTLHQASHGNLRVRACRLGSGRLAKENLRAQTPAHSRETRLALLDRDINVFQVIDTEARKQGVGRKENPMALRKFDLNKLEGQMLAQLFDQTGVQIFHHGGVTELLEVVDDIQRPHGFFKRTLARSVENPHQQHLMRRKGGSFSSRCCQGTCHLRSVIGACHSFRFTRFEAHFRIGRANRMQLPHQVQSYPGRIAFAKHHQSSGVSIEAMNFMLAPCDETNEVTAPFLQKIFEINLPRLAAHRSSRLRIPPQLADQIGRGSDGGINPF